MSRVSSKHLHCSKILQSSVSLLQTAIDLLKYNSRSIQAYYLQSFHGDNGGDTLKFTKYEQRHELISSCLSGGGCWSDE